MQKRIGTLAAWAVPIALMALAAHGQQEVPGYGGVGVFDLPALSSAEMLVVARAGSGDADAAAAELDALIGRFPDAAQLHVVRAALALMRNDRDAAVAALLEADKLGAIGLPAMLARPEWSALAGDARLAALEDRAAPEPAPVAPALVEQGRAPVGPANTAWEPSLARLIARFRFPPILGTHAFAEKLVPDDPRAALQQLVARGRAAGNVGDLYDNRDRGHSTLAPGQRVQLARVVYGPEAEAAGIDYGLNTQILFDAPTFGNSSTALTGPLWRSQPRLALTTPGGALRLWQLYANNHIYVFPEHQDHDPPAEGGHGDLIPANTPYMLISQGSSGSDKPFLEAVQAILAAFTPEVKARLVEHRLVAPTVQQVFRRGLAGVGEDGYLDPRAHPSVFRAEDIDLAAMIHLAQAMQADEIPPLVTLAMLTETPPNPSIFADGTTEILFDTPSAIARVWRAADAERKFELQAAATDPNGRPLEFRWRVLRGDADRIRIEPLDKTGARVRITLPWHQPMPVAGRPDITSPRVDIAVFADNGAQISAPAFFSMLYPAHQQRDYSGDGRALSIAHAPPGDAYVDPLIWPRQRWTDRFDYDVRGALLGWTRTTPAGESRFTAHGLEVLETDALGRAVLARRVDYPVTRREDGAAVVTPTPSEQRFHYDYNNDSDLIGRPTPVAAGN